MPGYEVVPTPSLEGVPGAVKTLPPKVPRPGGVMVPEPRGRPPFPDPRIVPRPFPKGIPGAVKTIPPRAIRPKEPREEPPWPDPRIVPSVPFPEGIPGAVKTVPPKVVRPKKTRGEPPWPDPRIIPRPFLEGPPGVVASLPSRPILQEGTLVQVPPGLPWSQERVYLAVVEDRARSVDEVVRLTGLDTRRVTRAFKALSKRGLLDPLYAET